MTALAQLDTWLRRRARQNSSPLYRSRDFRCLFPELTKEQYKDLLFRACSAGLLARVARGLYRDPHGVDSSGLLLFHAAAMLRPFHFNYISLETALSDAGWISQIPINWITIVSTGRSSVIECSGLGTVEFVHTKRNPADLNDGIYFDEDRHMYCATPAIALRDMRMMQRSTIDLVQEPDDEPAESES